MMRAVKMIYFTLECSRRSRKPHLCLLEPTVTDIQLYPALALIMMQPVHELDLLQILLMKLFPL